MFYYSLNGQQQGPVSEAELRQMVANGALAPDALVWREGMADWQPLAAVVPGISPTIQCSVCKQMYPPDQVLTISNRVVCANCKPTFVQGLREGVTGPDRTLYSIALHQRRVIMCVGVMIVCYLAEVLLAPIPVMLLVFFLGLLISGIFAIISVYRLANALAVNGVIAILCVLLMFIPCVGLLVCMFAVTRATAALKRGGVKVGLFGVSKQTLEQLRVA